MIIALTLADNEKSLRTNVLICAIVECHAVMAAMKKSKLQREILELPLHLALWHDDCEIGKLVDDLYNFFFQVNTLLLAQEQLSLFEHLVLGNTLSRMMSALQ